MNLHSIPTSILREAIEIREQIEKLEQRMAKLLGGSSIPTIASTERMPGRRKRRLSAEGRARIAAAARARWARQRGERKSAASPASSRAASGRRKLSPEARARIAAAAKARWARQKAAQGKA